MNKKPLKTKIIAVMTSIMTMTVMCLPAAAFAASNGVTKEETVYVVTDSSGTQQDVIVSDHLINKDEIKTISDETNLSDVENVCQAAPKAIVVASHLNSVNHALLTRKDIIEFANEKSLTTIKVPEDGECIDL